MSDIEWKLFEDIFTGKERKGRGMPAAHPHKILNLPLLILITGCPWIKSWYHDWTLNDMQEMILGITKTEWLILWNSGAGDGGEF
ncbi:MAG: hypothetical protein ACTFAK_17170 [Candidatus Electronema sp. VV]